MSGVYVASAARFRLAQAQAVVDAHPAGLDGRCLRCGVTDGCERWPALRVLMRYGRLPRRRPGATCATTASTPSSGEGFDWFAGTERTR